MDATILQLFSAEEIFKRLSESGATGALHVFTSKEAANAFFVQGTIVGAGKGLMQGEEVIQKILEWTDAHFTWQEGQAPVEGLRVLDLQFSDVLARGKAERRLGAMEPAAESPQPVISLPELAASTGPMLARTFRETTPFPEAPPPRPKAVKKQELVPVPTMSKTTSVVGHAPEDDSIEEALMRKHQLALVALGEMAPLRLRIIRSSNLVGRNPACDFTLNHTSISRQHCLLQIMDRGLHVKDLSTMNGTKVNGIPLTEGYVSVGDKLSMGNLDFLVEKDEVEV